MIQLNNVTKSYQVGDAMLSVLKGISLTMNEGSIVALVGPSGCGKSTLLNLLGGLDYTDGGSIVVDGTDLTQCKQKQLEQYRLNKIGTVFQSFNLIGHMNAAENVEVPLTLAGIGKEERRKRALELLEWVGLADRADHKPNQLSGGQKQRVAIARALALNPPILLADEPTGALDSKTSQQILELMLRISREFGTTIIMVTHSPEIAESADHIVSMRDGLIVNETHKKAVRNEAAVAGGDKKNRKGNMGFLTAIRHAGANLMQKRWRTLLVSIGASIGICGIALMVGLSSGIESKVTTELESIVSEQSMSVYNNEEKKEPLTAEQLAKVNALPGVKAAYQLYQFSMGIEYKGTTVSDYLFSSDPYDLVSAKEKKAQVIAGDYPKGEKEIVLSKKVAEQLVGKGNDFKTIVGQEITVGLQNISLKNSVSQSEQFKMKVSGVVKDGPLGVSMTAINYDFARNLSKKLDVKGIDQPVDTSVIAKTVDDVDIVKQKITDLGFVAKKDEEGMKKIKDYSIMAQVALGSLAGISLIVSSIMIGIVLYISVLERTKEIGVLQAIGARRRDIRRIFLTESGVIGTLGGVIGVVGAWLLGLVGNALVAYFWPEDAFDAFLLPIRLVSFCILFSLLLSLVAGWIPARRASRMNPIHALRQE